MLHYVYQIFKDDVLLYVGRSSTPIKRQKHFEWRENIRGTSLRYRAFFDLAQAQRSELYLINTLKPKHNKLMTSSVGIFGRGPMSAEHRRKIGQSNRGRVIGPEARARMGRPKGSKPWNYGKRS